MAEPQLRFSFKVYQRPFRVPVRTSQGVWPARDGVLTRVEQENGDVAFGEIAPMERFGTETLAGAVAWCATLGGQTSPTRLRETPRRLPCCVAAFDGMLRALESLAVSATPRNGATETPQSNRSLHVACLLPHGASAHDALARAVDAGFTTFKRKIGTGDFAGEVAAIAELVERLPGGGKLRLDANGGLDLRAAVRWLEVAVEWPVEFVEQPLPVGADRDLVRLANDHAVPVALDESVRGADDIKRWRDRGWTGLFVIKPGIAGAVDDLLHEVAIAPDAFVWSSALETAIGTAVGVHLAFTAGVSRALGYGVGAFFPDDGLGGGVAAPSITASDVLGWNLEDVWNRL